MGESRRSVLCLLACLLTLSVLLPAMAAPLLDPQIRAAQFEARLGHPQAALARLQADRQLGYLDHQPAQADLQLAELYLQLGLPLQAAEVFQRLGEGGGAAAATAWFRLGRLQHLRGENAAALNAFAHIRTPLPGEMQQERLLLEGELLLRSERFAEAEDRLRALVAGQEKRSDWVDFGRFNLAVTLFRSGREDEARELLLLLSKQNTSDGNLRTLSDKANLTLAYDRLEAGDIDAATAYFKKGRLSGPVSNTALMGMGRAYAAQGKYKKALVPWLKLSKRDAADPLVQDALLAVPYGFGKLNAFKQALQYYKQALAVFRLELERIEKVEGLVNSGEMVSRLIGEFAGSDVLTLDRLPGLPTGSGAAHLWRLFSTNAFQESLRSALRAEQSLKKISEWTSQVEADERISSKRREALLAQSTTLENRLIALSEELHTHMQSLALQELEHRRKRILAYNDEVRFSIAQIYDYAAQRWGGR